MSYYVTFQSYISFKKKMKTASKNKHSMRQFLKARIFVLHCIDFVYFIMKEKHKET